MRCKILSQKKSELANFGYIKKVSWKIAVEKFFEYQKSLKAKKPQKLPKNLPKIFFNLSLTKNPIKILNNNKNPLTSSNKTKNPSMSFELITVKYDCKCSLTGKNFSPGEQVYYNYQAKTFLDPVYYENMQSQINSSGVQSYFQRHQKLNKVNQKTQ